MILGDRDVFVGAHLTPDSKEKFRIEALRRGVSMSALLAQILDEWLVVAADEQIEPVRSNKRIRVKPVMNPNEEDIPLPFPQ